MKPIIKVQNLGKKYRIGALQSSPETLRDVLAGALRAPLQRFRKNGNGDSETIWALDDINFEIKQGEVVGIIGRNGAGKSTLLKILSRITKPTTGSAQLCGRVGSLLEVGTGFHPELTGRENIFLNGSILGMRRREISSKFDEIVAFAEVEKFIDTPVKRYSSGMQVRLAFAVAAYLDPEVMIIDEVLAVGDASFQKKCLNKMGRISREGRTILFVSHNMLAVKSLCTRGILFDKGKIVFEGQIDRVVERFITNDLGTPQTSLTLAEDTTLRIQFLEVEIISHHPTCAGEEILFRCKYLVRETTNVMLCVEVRNTYDLNVFYSNDELLNDSRKRNIGIHTVTLSIPAYLLSPGEYRVAFGFWEPGHAAEHFPDDRLTFRREEPVTRLSTHGIAWPSVIYMPNTWNYIENQK